MLLVARIRADSSPRDVVAILQQVCFNIVSLLAHGVVVAQQVLILLVVVRFYMGLPSFNGVEASMVMH